MHPIDLGDDVSFRCFQPSSAASLAGRQRLRLPLGQIDPLPLSDLELCVLETEERPSPLGAIEDPAENKALLGV